MVRLEVSGGSKRGGRKEVGASILQLAVKPLFVGGDL